MAKNRRFIIYTYHNHTLPVELPERKVQANKRGFFASLGAVLAYPFVQIWRGMRYEQAATARSVRRRLGYAKTRAVWKNAAVFALVCLVMLGAFQSTTVVTWALNLKQELAQLTQSGGDHLTDAIAATKGQDYSGAKDEFDKAYETFTQGSRQLSAGSALLNELSNVIPQKRSAQNILSAAGLVSQAGASMVDFAQNMQQLKLTPQGIASSSSTADTFQKAQQDLQQTVALVGQAAELVKGVNPNDVPSQYREKLANIQNETGIMLSSLQNLQDVLKVSGSLFLGDKTILLLFENNNELRPAGGFMGTFGALKMHDGSIQNLRISSIYDLDGQLQERIVPPSPMLNVNNRWYLRDSNWFADFPASAKEISTFYEKEGGETPDVIMVMTPNLIQDLLGAVGPVELPDYHVTLTPDNFVEQTQALTTTSEENAVNAPKQMLAILVPIMLQKLAALPSQQWPQVLVALEKNLNSKQIVFYSRDSGLESTLSQYHWTGELLPTDRDYLSMVWANLGGTKTDLSVSQSISLTSDIAADGSIQNTATITRTNSSQNLKDSDNISFFRMYVPLGSELVSASGIEQKDLTPQINKGDKIDADVRAWQQSVKTDQATGAMTGQESGKTFFGGWQTLKSGESKTITVSYKLPFKLGSIDRYGLLVQKQIGAVPAAFNAIFRYAGRRAEWQNFKPSAQDGQSSAASASLDTDMFFGIVLQNTK